MRAIELEKAGCQLRVVEKEQPNPRPDGVVIRMLAAPVLSYMQAVVDGKLPYQLPGKPFVPGTDAIGLVESVGTEVFDLAPGTLVHAGPQIASRYAAGTPDQILIGLTGMSAESSRLQDIWTDGAFAEFVHYPVDAVTPLTGFEAEDATRLAAIMYLAVPYGGLLSIDFKPTETVIIGGATGNFGAHGIMMALAMGAGKVIPIGRNKEALDKLQQISPARVCPAVLSGDLEKDTAAVVQAAGGLVDCFLDIVGGGSTNSILSSMRALKNKGRVALMGALQEPINIPYVEIMVKELTIKGNFMYPQTAAGEITRLIQAGLIDWDLLDIKTFELDNGAEAVREATGRNGLSFNVITGLNK